VTDKQFCRKPWYEYVQEAENAKNFIEYLFGSNSLHEHQKLVGYLEGWIAGIRFLDKEREREAWLKDKET